ncbi:hypothetical protein ACFV9D_14325 [Streptomyces sp. NPDC059875]|uniref:hypothetical protein n=1 Tax=unclassified Streptomyces TaxID=2593676 RepID=UPI00365534A5
MLPFVVTLIGHDWIALLFGVEPDTGRGALEWLLVAVMALATVLCALGARMEWRRTHPVAHTPRARRPDEAGGGDRHA